MKKEQGLGLDQWPVQGAVEFRGEAPEPVWRRKVKSLVKMARGDRRALMAALIGDVRVNKVYSRDTALPVPLALGACSEIAPLSERNLRSLQVSEAKVRTSQLELLSLLGRSYAYAATVEGEIAHISWLLPAAASAMETPMMFRLSENQAEISASHTLLKYRGRGIYRSVIWQLLSIARQRGVAKIYMKTNWDNKASQKAIRKAGFEFAGIIVRLKLPLSWRVWVLRLYV